MILPSLQTFRSIKEGLRNAALFAKTAGVFARQMADLGSFVRLEVPPGVGTGDWLCRNPEGPCQNDTLNQK